MRCGFVYLVAVMDWFSRRVLAWRLSNMLTTDFCLEAVRDALARHGRPAIFNTDQGSQFISGEAKANLDAYLRLYNERRPHRALDGKSSDAVYFAGASPEGRAA